MAVEALAVGDDSVIAVGEGIALRLDAALTITAKASAPKDIGAATRIILAD